MRATGVVWLLQLPPEQEQEGPRMRLAGRSLLARHALLLRNSGCERVLLVCRPGDLAAWRELLRAEGFEERGDSPSVSLLTAETADEALRRLCETADGPVVVTAPWVLPSARTLEALVQRGPSLRSDLVVPCADGAWLRPGRAPTPPSRLPLPALATARGLQRLTALRGTLQERIEQARDEPWASELNAPGWVLPVGSPEQRRAALERLLDDCRKPVDGWVSRYLNRYVSLAISRHLVDRPVSPNAITLLALLLGVAAAAAAAQGPGWPMLLGAVLLQLNSILDGVDGELARLRMRSSRFGQWFDTIVDDTVNVLFYGAVAAGAARGGAPGWLVASGWTASALGLLTMGLYYTELWRRGSGDFYALGIGSAVRRRPPGWRGRLAAVLDRVTKKDFFIAAFVVLAALGVLPWVLPVVMCGTVGTVVAGARLHWQRLCQRADRSTAVMPPLVGSDGR